MLVLGCTQAHSQGCLPKRDKNVGRMHTFSSILLIFFVTFVWPFLLLAIPLFCSWLDRFTGARYQPLPTPSSAAPSASVDESGLLPGVDVSGTPQPQSVRFAAASTPVTPSVGELPAVRSAAGGPVGTEALIWVTGRSA